MSTTNSIFGPIAATTASVPEYVDTSLVYAPPVHNLKPVAAAGFLTAPTAGNPFDIAINYVNQNATSLGLNSADVSNYVVTDHYSDKISGTTHVYLKQTHNGLPISNALLNINVTSIGQVISAHSTFVAGMGKTVSEIPTPTLTSVQALEAITTSLGLPSGQSITVESAGTGINQASVLIAPTLSPDNIPAKLQYVMTPDGLKLAWNFVIRTKNTTHWYDASADAKTGKLIANADWVDHASYQALKFPNESVADGGFSTVVNPQDSTASPFGWHDTNGIAGAEFTDTQGNNTDAHLDRNGDDFPDSGSRPSGGASLDFSGYTFNSSGAPSTSQNENAAVVNLFYATNAAHDIHYKYGFDEASGNFQVTNYSGQGIGGDALQADAQDAADQGATDNANMGTPPEGQSPRMQMYEFTLSSPRRDSDLDNGVIIHEFGHGVSNRLTGGPSNASALDTNQSGGMGEGWSDWWALMLTQRPTDTQNQAMPIGTYVLNQPANGSGIRRFPYSFDMNVDPLTLNDYNGDGEVHDTGEIWCTTLWDLNWALINKYGYDSNLYSGYDKNAAPGTPTGAGNKLAMQLVMDGLKLQPANPSFLDARDAIIQADQVLTGGKNYAEIWTVFARRGFGFSADVGGNSNSLSVNEAFDLPPDAILRERFDSVTSPNLPFAWSSQSTSGSSAWTTSTVSPFNGANDAFIPAAATVSDTSLKSPVVTYLKVNNRLTFQNSYDLETVADFAKLEMSVNGGAFTDIVAAGGNFVTGGYTSGSGWSGNSGGYVLTTVELPISAAGKTVQFRWRLTTNASVGSAGWRIDDIALDLAPQPDFGDAPDSYGTTLASDGARHTAAGPTLGLLRDGEADAVKPLNGFGDDASGSADEDGVKQGVLIAGGTGTLVVNVSANSFLNAWVDLNYNGTFDPEEQIAINQAMTTGNNTLHFTVPSDPKIASLFARFRLTSQSVASPSPKGLLPDGEVEDYSLTVGRVFENFDSVTAPVLPSGWSSVSSGSDWTTISTGSDTPRNNAFVPDLTFVSDNSLVSPTFVYQIGDQLQFRQNYDLESTYDGGVLEISIDGGAFMDIIDAGGGFLTNGYNSVISTQFGSPISGRSAWSGTSGGYLTTVVTLPDSGAGRDVQLRWREGTDDGVANSGWHIDSIISSIAAAAVNTAPVLLDANVALDPIGPNSPAPSGAVGTLVSSLVDITGGGGLNNVSDNDLAAVTGMAIIGSDETHGTWYYSTSNGVVWNALGSVSAATARLLAADANTRVYFQPNAGYTGILTAGLTFRAWDRTTGANGSTVDTTTNGNDTPFSTATDTADISVQNSAPTIDLSIIPRMIPVAKDTTTPLPTQVGTFSLNSFQDRDFATPVGGIALISADSANGTWTYSTDGGSTWLALGTVSNSAARLLVPTDLLKFMPNAGYLGNATISYRAWDQSTGVAGSTADLTGGVGGITAFSANSQTASVRVAPVSLLFGEDVVNTGKTTSLLGSATIGDVDPKAKKGVAIVGSGGTLAGHWEYFVTAWKPLSATIDTTTAIPLRSTDKIRFVPDTDAVGEAYLEFRAWDQTEGVAGTALNLTSAKLGGGGAFSIASDYFFTRVTPLNDKPVIDVASKGTLTNVAPTDTNPAGNLVSAILGTTVTDADLGTIPGIAITSLGKTGGGVWQYQLASTSTWIAIPAVTAAKALLLGPNDRLRFLPDNTVLAAEKTIQFKAWDQSTGVIGTQVNTAVGTAFSVALGSAVCKITTDAAPGANSAPVLNTSPDVRFTNIAEDSKPLGDTVASLLGSAVTDTPGALSGIAITGLTGTKTGQWQYSLNGKIWVAIPSVSDENALLLRSIDKLRYLPGLNFNGDVTISYRAWDQTRGTAAQRANPSLFGGIGGSGPFSTAVETATISVKPINDAPVLDINPTPLLTSVLPNATNPAGDLVANLLGNSITDVDAAPLKGIGVVRATLTHGMWQFQLANTTKWIEIGGSSTKTAYLLRDVDRVRFVPKAGFNGTETLMYRGWDQSSGTFGRLYPTTGSNALSTAIETATIYVNNVNDRPQLDTRPDNRLPAETVNITNPVGTPVTAVIAKQVQDPDLRDPTGIAVVYVDNRFGNWEFSTNAGVDWQGLADVSPMVSIVLRSTDLVRFIPKTGFTGLTTFKFKAWDQTDRSVAGTVVPTISTPARPINETAFSLNTEVVTLSVNSAPTLTPI